MILVSFFLEDNVLSDEIKICNIFDYQSNENRAFRFWGDTRYNQDRPICDFFLLHNVENLQLPLVIIVYFSFVLIASYPSPTRPSPAEILEFVELSCNRPGQRWMFVPVIICKWPGSLQYQYSYIRFVCLY